MILIMAENYKTYTQVAIDILTKMFREILDKFKSNESAKNNFSNKFRKRCASKDTEYEVMFSVKKCSETKRV